MSPDLDRSKALGGSARTSRNCSDVIGARRSSCVLGKPRATTRPRHGSRLHAFVWDSRFLATHVRPGSSAGVSRDPWQRSSRHLRLDPGRWLRPAGLAKYPPVARAIDAWPLQLRWRVSYDVT